METNILKIGFDAKRAFLNSSGLGNYSRTLITNLQNFYPANNYHLFTSKNTDVYFKPNVNLKIQTPQTTFDKHFPMFWRSYSATLGFDKLGLTIYHGLSNELPQNVLKFKGKKIVTIHDLIFMRYPKLYKPLDRKIYEKKVKHACKVADVIIAVSEQTKNDIVIFFGINPNKIKVIYQAVDERFLKPILETEQQQIKTEYNLPTDFLLYVGTIEERKNLLSILKAIKDLPNQTLVVVGKKRNYFKHIQAYILQNNLTNRVFFPENISNADLPKIYSLAKAFVYPSLFEGFGIPIIEAIACKVPVISTKGGCFAEAGGNAALYTTFGEIDELKQAIVSVTENDELRAQLINEGQKHISNFYPEKTSKELMALYKEV